jgi:hypothetical protein
MTIAGVFCALFAAALLLLPSWRVMRGELPRARAVGLWTSGCGFALLAATAFGAFRDRSGPAVMAGIILTIVGNFVQRRNTRRDSTHE